MNKKEPTPMELLEQEARSGGQPDPMPPPPSLLDTILLSVRRPPAPSAQPTLLIADWRISEVTVKGKRQRHVWGWNLHDREGRASTAITDVRVDERVLITESGRRYRLVGPSGKNADGAWVWDMWRTANDATEEIDVTEELQAILPTEQ